MTDGCDISSEIALRLTSWDLSDDKSTLVQVMAWCRQATSHYLKQCWPRSLPPYGVTMPQSINTLGTVLFVTYESRIYKNITYKQPICVSYLHVIPYVLILSFENQKFICALDHTFLDIKMTPKSLKPVFMESKLTSISRSRYHRHRLPGTLTNMV